MDWTNERYVRIYTRDTADLMAIGWQGRTVLWEMIRKADRAGIIDGDEDTLPDLLRLPRDITKEGISRLLKRGTVERGQSAYVVVNFIEAQEAKQSDRQRQAKSRAKRRDRARSDKVTNRDSESQHTVTSRDNKLQDTKKTSQSVTPCHGESHRVTPSLSVPSLAVPNRTDPKEVDTAITVSTPKKLKKVKKANTGAKSATTWKAYAGAYRHRYGVDPIRNAKVSTHLCAFIDRLGILVAPAVAAWYLRSNNSYYVARKHPVDALLKDAEKLHTEWLTQSHGTQAEAREGDRLQNTGQNWQEVINELGE